MTAEIPAHWPTIPDFFAGRSILITGATGFIGKALIEKLLRSCPAVREIFLLMRPKQNMSIDQRLMEMMKSQIFDELRKTNPAYMDKLIPVQGDVAEEGLGLPPVERQVLIERVSVIFHAAANVKFDDSLKHAVFVNTRSTRDICILGASMKNLVALLHVSSTYTQSDKSTVDEVYYDPKINWKKMIRLAETLDEKIFDTIMLKYINPMPNTYTFTKRVAEKVVNDYSKDVPSVLLRPSIVISAVKEPLTGWVDNLNGPVGIMIGGGKGILRVLYTQSDVTADYMPVDIVIKTMLISAWKRGMQTITQDPSLHIYNCASGDIRRLGYRDVAVLAFQQHRTVPLSYPIWYPALTFTDCYIHYYILVLLLHVLPSLLIDATLKLTGRRGILLKIHRKIYTANMTLSVFLKNVWKFNNQKGIDLMLNVHESDREAFSYDFSNLDLQDFFKASIVRTKQFILREDVTKMDDDKRYLDRLYWLRMFKNFWLICVFVWYIMQFETFPYIKAIIGGLILLQFLQH